MRKIIIAGNWKMNKTCTETREFFESLLPKIEGLSRNVVVGVPFTSLQEAVKLTKGSIVKIAAQNMNPNEKGAYTGEVSPLMLKDLGVEYVILGHSERRAYYHETNEFINEKVKSALKHDLRPILCIGEKLEDRENGTTTEVVKEQLVEGLKGVSKEEDRKSVV